MPKTLLLLGFVTFFLPGTVFSQTNKGGVRKEIAISTGSFYSYDFQGTSLQKQWWLVPGIEDRGFQTNESARELAFVSGKWAYFYYYIAVTDETPRRQLATLLYRMKNTDPSAQFEFAVTFYGQDTNSTKNVQVGYKALSLTNQSRDFRSAELGYEIPQAALFFRVGVITSRSTGELLLKGLRIEKQEVMEAAMAAALGIAPSQRILIRGRDSGEETSLLQVTFANTVPFEINAPFWQGLKKLEFAKLAGGRTDSPTLQLACDDKALYVRFHANDNTPVSGNVEVYKNDCFEFYFSPSGYAFSNQKYGFHLGPASTAVQFQVAASIDGKVSLGGLNYGPETGMEGKAVRSGTENTALMRIPWSNQFWSMAPFDGFKFTGNAVYHDYRTPGDSGRNVFRPDPEETLYRNTSRFVPMEIFRSSEAFYAPVVLPQRKAADKVTDIPALYSGVYNVEEPGFNLSSKEFSLGPYSGDVKFRFDPNNLTNQVEIDGQETAVAKELGQPEVLSRAFMINPGETILVKVRARSEKKTHTLGGLMLSQHNWKYITANCSNVITPQWQELEFRMKATEIFSGMNRNVRMRLSVGKIHGDRIWLADRRIVRMNPVPFDMQLYFEGKTFNHFFGNEDKKLILRVHNASPDLRKAKLVATVKDYLTGKEVASFDRDVSLPGSGEVVLEQKIVLDKKGVFEINASLGQENEAKVSRDFLFTVGEDPRAVVSDYYGAWHGHHDTTMYTGVNEMAGFIKRCGFDKILVAYPMGPVTSSVRVSETEYGHYGLIDPLINTYASNGMKIGVCFQGFKWGMDGITESSTDRIYDLVHSFLSHYRGKIDNFQYGTEMNLSADGRERAIQLRTAYNAAKQADPGVTFVTLAPNVNSRSYAMDYVGAYHQINGAAFTDGVSGIHEYNFQMLEDGFKYFMKDRNLMESILPGFTIWDTESGLVRQSVDEHLFSMTKKMPEHLCKGITRHYIYDMPNYFIPGNAASVSLPALNFQVVIFDKAVALGYLELGDQVIGYVFRKPDDTTFAVLWRTRQSLAPTDAVIPMEKEGFFYDQFGNVISKLKQGDNSIHFDDRYVRYVTGIHFEKAISGKSFLPAWQKSKRPYSRAGLYADCVDNPYLVFEPFVAGFDRKLQAGKTHEISVLVRNDSPVKHMVRLLAEYPRGLSGKITPSEVSLSPNEKKMVLFSIDAAASFERGFVKISGISDGIGKMAPITFSAEKSDEIVFSGYSRFAEFKNTASEPVRATFLLNDKRVSSYQTYSLTPALFSNVTLAGDASVMPLTFTLGQKQEGTEMDYKADLEYLGKNHPVSGKFYYMKTDAGQKDGAGEWQTLRYTLNPEFSQEGFVADLSVLRTEKDLRFVVRVKDPSPNGNDDKLILGFDVGPANSGLYYGNEDFDCTFSTGVNGQIYASRFNWKVGIGLEAAAPFPQAVRKIERRDGSIYYDIAIPFSEFDAKAGVKDADRIGFSILIENKNASGNIEKIRFGGGLDKLPRRSIEFGILQLKDAK